MTTLKSIIGLFFPIYLERVTTVSQDGLKTSEKKEWSGSLTFGEIPAGWIILAISYAATFIPHP